jgi:tetratricopeptide (TPR) repeat protein
MKKLLASCLFFCTLLSFAQQHSVDSLQALINKDKNDTLKIQHMDYLGYEYIKLQKFDLAYKKLQESASLAQQLLKEHSQKDLTQKTLTRGLASAHHFIGMQFYYQAQYDSAIFNFEMALKLNTEIGNKKGMNKANLNLGAIYYYYGNYDKALVYFIGSLKLSDALGDKETEAGANGNIGAIYMAQLNNKKALYYFNEGLKLYKELDNKYGLSNSYMNIGSVYTQSGDLKNALENLTIALKLKEEVGIPEGIADIYANIGNVHWKLKDYDLALKNYLKSYDKYASVNNVQGLTFCNTYIGLIYVEKKEYSKALPYLNKALESAKQLGLTSTMQDAYNGLSLTYAATNNYKLAYESRTEYGKLRDTLFNQSRVKQMAEMDARYLGEKKEQQLKVLKAEQEKEREVAEQKSKIQLIIIGAVALGLLLVAVFAVFVARSLRTTKHQKDIIEEKQREILDSIHYAKKIQTALMSNEKHIHSTLGRLNR